MRWTTTDAERFLDEMPLALRLAGGGVLAERLVALAGGLGEAATWCLALSDSRPVLLVADGDHVLVLRGSDSVAAEVIPLADVRIQVSAEGRTVGPAAAPILLEAGSGHGVPAFVAHLVARLAHVQHIPGVR